MFTGKNTHSQKVTFIHEAYDLEQKPQFTS